MPLFLSKICRCKIFIVPLSQHYEYQHLIYTVMKKLFTLFLAAVAALNLMALPQTKLATLQHDAANPLSSNQQRALRIAAQDLSKHALHPVQMPERKLPTKLSINPSAKATNALTLDGGVFLVEPEYEDASGEWYIAVESNGYTFRLCWYGSEDTFAGSYTIDDISMEYSWGWYQSADLFYEIYFADVNMTISEEQVGDCLKQIILDATIMDTNDQTYVLHIVHNAFTPKTTIESTLTNTTLTMGDGLFVLDGNNDELDVQLTVNAFEVGNFYTLNDFNMDATAITYKGQEQQLLKADLYLELGMLESGLLGYYVELSYINQDTILHTVQMPAPLPPAKDTIRVKCTNLDVDESFGPYGIMMITGDNDLYDIFAMYPGEYAEEGVYTDVSLSITDKRTWEMQQSISATLTLTETNNGWHVNMEAYCSDYYWYSINMVYEVPTPTDTVQIAFDQAAIATYLPTESNMIQLLNYGKDFEASVTVYGVELGQEFTMANVYLDYSGIYDCKGEHSVQIADIHGVLNQHGDTTTITASVIGFNAVQYDVYLWYTAPTPTDTIVIEMPVEFANAMDMGYYTLSAYTPDSAWYVSLSPLTSEVAGTFINDGVFGKFGAVDGHYDFYSGMTFVYSEAEWKNYTVEKGTLVVEMAEDGAITAQADIICSNAKYFRIKMTSKYNTHLDYDEPYEEVDRIYTTNDYVTIDNQIANYGYVYLGITAADESDMAAFFFFAEEADEDIIIPEGVYTIDSSEEYGTVYANPGVQGDGVWPSYYAQMLEDGSIVVPLWLLVSGTVEVTKDDNGNPYMEVNAYNSYGVPVHIIYDGRGTGLENVEGTTTTATKQFVNGQLLIKRNGEIFNATGARVK